MLKLTKINNLKFYYRSNDRYIGQRIALDKYEKYETALLLSHINKNSVCVDVGANIGYYTLLMAKRVKKVYAFEPDKKCFEILKKNVEENNLKNVVLINKAASDKEGEKFFEISKNNFGDNRIKSPPTPSLNKEGAINYIKINTCLLDDVLKNEQKISLIKIDTQGWEPQVVLGAKKIINRDKPTLFLEYTPTDYKDKKMINFLEKVYSDIFSINDFAEVPWPIDKGIKIRANGYCDLFLKERMRMTDYWIILKNVNYKKWVKGIINYGNNKTN